MLSNSILQAVVDIAGDPIRNSICLSSLESIESAPLTARIATISFTALIHFLRHWLSGQELFLDWLECGSNHILGRLFWLWRPFTNTQKWFFLKQWFC
jgi:hypothetical protein